MREFILLFINGQKVEIRGAAVFGTLAQFLRHERGKTGTKIVCEEGDCGACAVLVGRPSGNRLSYQPITSCIAVVHQFDGAHVITVEGLQYDRAANPVQQAMVDCHGVQCGFCTPGFVVSLCGMFEQKPAATLSDCREALMGNLCRCTGYQSIIESAGRVDPGSVRALNELYPSRAMVDELSSAAAEPVLVEAAGRRFYKAVTIADAARFKAANPDCRIIAGGTDLGVYANKGKPAAKSVMALGGIRELNGISVTDEHLSIGGNATLSELEQIAGESFPELAGMLGRHGSPLIRNLGTLAGNIANGSSIGDALPALFVLNGEIELTSVSAGAPLNQRRVNINQFYSGYKQTAMRGDEFITRVDIPRLRDSQVLRLYKVSKRRDVDISTFTAAIWARVERETVREIRIACGGVAPTVVRLTQTESLLAGKTLSLTQFQVGGRMARREIQPISDVRGSSDYRLQLAENIFSKFFHDLTGVLTHSTSGNGQTFQERA